VYWPGVLLQAIDMDVWRYFREAALGIPAMNWKG
jgi:hypothetical protein